MTLIKMLSKHTGGGGGGGREVGWGGGEGDGVDEGCDGL